jgi:serine/threonine protein phosphatase 1
MGRTFAFGDIHGDLDALWRVLRKLPTLTTDDTLVFLGDYVDRGPDSAGVVEFVRFNLPRTTPAKVVALRGNHEDGWLRIVDGTWPMFAFPTGNGCLACLRSYGDGDPAAQHEATSEEFLAMTKGDFLPRDVVEWMQNLPVWLEDEHAIYVHAGLLQAAEDGAWLHPRDTEDQRSLMWTRTKGFFETYGGKRVVVGHTPTTHLPPELSEFTPDDPGDMWVNKSVIVVDTGCGKPDGFLTAVELPAVRAYESRD